MDEIIAVCGSKILDLNQGFYLNALPFNFGATGRSISSEEYSDGLLAALTELATKAKRTRGTPRPKKPHSTSI